MIFGCKIDDFQEVFSKRIRKTPQDKHKMLQDAPKTPPRGGPARARSWKKLGSKSDLQRTLLQTLIFERLGVDLGRFLDGFRELLRSIFHGFYW